MHEIHTEVFSMKTSKEKIKTVMDSYARKHGEYHQGIDRIDWIDSMEPFSNEDEAYEYVRKYLFGDYEQVAVPFLRAENVEAQVKGHPRLEASYRKVQEARQKAYDARNECLNLERRFHFGQAKAAYISCRHCGSKISRDYLKTNYCPVCHADMRPRSTLDSISSKKKKAEELEEKASSLDKELRKKLKSEEMWLVKIEYHV